MTIAISLYKVLVAHSEIPNFFSDSSQNNSSNAEVHVPSNHPRATVFLPELPEISRRNDSVAAETRSRSTVLLPCYSGSWKIRGRRFDR